jgi:phosphoglycolate phosphatase
MKLAVFDVDGTLVDSRASIASAMDAAFVAVGLAAPGYEVTRTIVGMSLTPAIAQLAGDVPADVVAELQREYVTAFRRRRESGVRDPLYDGAESLLREMKTQGWLMTIATGKSRAGVDAILSGHALGGIFDAIHCADDGPGKPDPHMLICSMRAVGSDPADTIMIGDTSHDMAMARAAGVYAQGVTWGFHTEAEMRAGGAHGVAGTFRELREALTTFGVNGRAASAAQG